MSKCKTCCFFQMHQTEENVNREYRSGFCRRYPPYPLVVSDIDSFEFVTSHPTVWEDFWCGEHKGGSQFG